MEQGLSDSTKKGGKVTDLENRLNVLLVDYN